MLESVDLQDLARSGKRELTIAYRWSPSVEKPEPVVAARYSGLVTPNHTPARLERSTMRLP